jgi:hypothetical protein
LLKDVEHQNLALDHAKSSLMNAHLRIAIAKGKKRNVSRYEHWGTAAH